MSFRKFVGPVLLLIAIGALLFRLPDRGNRPFHADESVHTDKLNTFWKHGEYHYDPNEYHGPTMYYATVPVLKVLGRQTYAQTRESDYRLVTVLFGAAIILLLCLMADGLGPFAAVVAGLLLAVSPAFVFYSRYYIQESLFAFFTLAMLGCAWQYYRRRTLGWMAGVGACVGLMLATKETAVLSLVMAVVAIGITSVWSRVKDRQTINTSGLWAPKHIAVAAVIALVIACFLLSGFKFSLSGLHGLLLSYTPWLHRANGTDIHRHPWLYYLQKLAWNQGDRGPVWSEALILGLAAVGFIAALFTKQKHMTEGRLGFIRFIAFYTVLLTIAYSAIPYKTPWCVLSFLNGMILLAGFGVVTLVRLVPSVPLKAIAAIALFVGGGQLAAQAYRASFVYPTMNPYAYSQTAPDVEDLETRIKDLGKVSPEGDKMVIKIISADNYYWPLPWYLREFDNIGYYNSVPADANASVVIASTCFDDQLNTRIGSTHMATKYYGLRSGALYDVWVRMDLWTKFIETRQKVTTQPQIGE